MLCSQKKKLKLPSRMVCYVSQSIYNSLFKSYFNHGHCVQTDYSNAETKTKIFSKILQHKHSWERIMNT